MGMGIPEDELPHIFERFYRGARPAAERISGYGLGLAMTQEIVELHGGKITVTSQIDQGSTFSLWLPLIEASD
jgi:signal transduction histidine kinase